MLPTVRIPSANGDSRRLLVALHGLGDSPNGYLWLPQALGLKWMNYALAQAPDAYYGGFSWYDLYDDPAPGIVRSRAALFELLGQFESSGVSAENITLFGFSQGCLMALEAAARYPKRFAGVVGVSGYVYEPEAMVRELSPAARQQRILVTHGTRDPLIPIDGTKAQIKLLQESGMQIDWREFIKAHTLAGDEELAVIREFVLGGYAPA